MQIDDHIRRRQLKGIFPNPPAKNSGPQGKPPSKMKKFFGATREVLKDLPRKVKRGAMIGGISGALVMGYKDNLNTAYESSLTAHRDAAAMIVKERDPRSFMQKGWDKVRGKEGPKEVPVGKSWSTKRGPQGELLEIGKKNVWLGARIWIIGLQ